MAVGTHESGQHGHHPDVDFYIIPLRREEVRRISGVCEAFTTYCQDAACDYDDELFSCRLQELFFDSVCNQDARITKT